MYKISIPTIFAISLIFIQVGFSYYISFQVFALLLILGLASYSAKSFKNINESLFFILLFSIFLCFQGLHEPLIVKRNYSNITFTIIALIFYASILAILPNLIIKKPIFLLKVFKFTSALTICSLALLMLIIDLSLFSSLDREFFLLQNVNLIANATDIDMIQANINARARNDNYAAIDHDLFYGEKSYLAIVIFTCIGSYILTSKLIIASQLELTKSKTIFFRDYIIVMIGFISIINIGSLSAIIYAILIAFYIIRQSFGFGKINLLHIFTIIISIAVTLYIFINNSEYLFHRVSTMEQSLSLSQRFGPLINLNILDYFFGLRDVSRMPKEGFHNGIIYLIAISGFGGILFLTFLLGKIYFLARPLRMSTFFSLLFLAQASQNGAFFSPDKLVLYAMILLPLSCVWSLGFERKPAL